MRAAASIASSPLTSIFLGSQPRSAQVPPNGRWSMTATDHPAARTWPIATWAAVPLQMTIRSYWAMAIFLRASVQRSRGRPGGPRDRKSGVQEKRVLVRVDLAVRGIHHKNTMMLYIHATIDIISIHES